jgi:MFS family permease
MGAAQSWSMGRAWIEDAYTIRRNRLLWAVPVLVVLAAAACMPVNIMWVNSINFDPQGEDQVRDHYETMAVWRHTSGFMVGTTLAALVGTLLFLKRRRPEPDRTEPAAVAATVAWAAFAGVILAAINVAVAWLLGGPKLIVASWLGDPIVVDVVHDERIWRVIVGWAAMFPVVAVVGVGLGALIRRVGRLSTAYKAPEGHP